MAANYIELDRTTEIGRRLSRYGQMLREAVDGLAQTRAAMIQMRDGDGSQAAHYDVLAAEAGYVANDYADANTAARASFLELDSLLSKVNTDAEVSFVRAALDQFCAKHVF